MDLIDRAAAIETLGEPHPLDYNMISAVEKIRELPTIEAVPLDKLCEWLTANRVSIPCRLCEYDDAGECTVQNDMSKPCPNTTRDWRRVITKWMEGLDDHR